MLQLVQAPGPVPGKYVKAGGQADIDSAQQVVEALVPLYWNKVNALAYLSSLSS